jgi:hypothetical protein
MSSSTNSLDGLAFLVAARLRERSMVTSSIDAASPHRRRMAQIMKTDEAANPIPVGFLRAAGCSGEFNRDTASHRFAVWT